MGMTDSIKPLYTAHATAVGGRNGHTRSDDGMVDVNLSVPKEMGGPGKPGTATPEHLFAAGYAACFGGALDFVAKQHKKDASRATVQCAVTIGPREGGGFGLAVALEVTDTSLPQTDLQSLVNEAHEKICPYSPRHPWQRGRESGRARGVRPPMKARGRSWRRPRLAESWSAHGHASHIIDRRLSRNRIRVYVGNSPRLHR
jgi:osmotically inducible protein OsmC